MRRLPFVGAVIALIAMGLVLRLVPWGMPLWAHHFGGGLLWGAMLYLLVAACAPAKWRPVAIFAAASVIVIAVEGLRLYREPHLDAFRLTLAGQLLLGRIFSPWNILVDEIGASAAMLGVWCIARARAEKALPPHSPFETGSNEASIGQRSVGR